MNESWVTLQGWVGSEVTHRVAGTSEVASFRIGCTPRFFRGGAWVDGATSWYTVNAWRTLGQNVVESVHKGDAVVVHGRLRTDVWEREGQPTSVSYLVDATFVGHDLNRGVAAFQKVSRTDRTQSAEQDEAVREIVHGYPDEGVQLDAEGRPRVEPSADAA